MSSKNPWAKDIESLENGYSSSIDNEDDNYGFDTMSLNEGFESQITNFTLDEEEKND